MVPCRTAESSDSYYFDTTIDAQGVAVLHPVGARPVAVSAGAPTAPDDMSPDNMSPDNIERVA